MDLSMRDSRGSGLTLARPGPAWPWPEHSSVFIGKFLLGWFFFGCFCFVQFCFEMDLDLLFTT